MNRHEVVKHFPQTLTALGKCMDVMLENPDDKNALHICTVASNGLYLLCLKLIHNTEETATPELLEEIAKGAGLLTKACEAFAENRAGIDNVTEALRTLHTFQLCRQTIEDFTRTSRNPLPIAKASAD